jgi:hydroxymethylpyrimidine pyrophosphatase-like HAD family hydrolase
MRCVYCDLDGTLLGAGASLLRDGTGAFSALAVRALEACFRADVEFVIYSGRRQAQVSEDARLLGCRAYIFEVGSGLVMDGEREWLTGDLVPGKRSIHDQIEDAGAPALLLERYPRRLEYHEPWHRDREVSHLFRGLVDTFEADEALREAGMGHLRLVDNGAIRRRSPTLDVEQAHAYHLIPAQASKSGAVARHMQARGYAREECIAVGDSREDMDAADVVETFWLVANALERDPALREAIGDRENVRIAEGAHGAGVYEAVVTTLAERRP